MATLFARSRFLTVSPPEFAPPGNAGSGADADWAGGKGVCQVKPSEWPPAAAAAAERTASTGMPAMEGRRDPNPIGAASDSWPARSATWHTPSVTRVTLLWFFFSFAFHWLPERPGKHPQSADCCIMFLVLWEQNSATHGL